MKQNGSSIAVILVFIVVVLLFLFLGGGMAMGGMMGSGMMGSGWLWLPTLLTLSVGILLGWVIFGKK